MFKDWVSITFLFLIQKAQTFSLPIIHYIFKVFTVSTVIAYLYSMNAVKTIIIKFYCFYSKTLFSYKTSSNDQRLIKSKSEFKISAWRITLSHTALKCLFLWLEFC